MGPGFLDILVFCVSALCCCNKVCVEDSDNVVDITSEIKFIVAEEQFAKETPSSCYTGGIKKIANGRVVKPIAFLSAHDTNVFLSNCDADHAGVVDFQCSFFGAKYLVCYTPCKKSTAEFLDPKHTGSFKELQGKDVIVIGGCFNGFNEGHWHAISSARQSDRSFSNPKLLVLVESDKKLESKINKKIEKGIFSPGKNYLLKQCSRSEVISLIPRVDYIICVPSDYTDENYLGLLKKLNVIEMVICSDNPTTVLHCTRHLEALRLLQKGSAGVVPKEKVVNLRVFSKENIDQNSTSFLKNKR